MGGLAIAALANPKSVLLTDVTQVHDTFTRPNLLLNSRKDAGNVAGSAVLHWNDLLVSGSSDYSKQFDTIVGFDLVYDPEICPLLVSILSGFFLAIGSSVKTVLLVCTLRNPDTFESFLGQLEGIPGVSVTVSTVDPGDLNDEIVLNSIESFRIVKAIMIS